MKRLSFSAIALLLASCGGGGGYASTSIDYSLYGTMENPLEAWMLEGFIKEHYNGGYGLDREVYVRGVAQDGYVCFEGGYGKLNLKDANRPIYFTTMSETAQSRYSRNTDRLSSGPEALKGHTVLFKYSNAESGYGNVLENFATSVDEGEEGGFTPTRYRHTFSLYQSNLYVNEASYGGSSSAMSIKEGGDMCSLYYMDDDGDYYRFNVQEAAASNAGRALKKVAITFLEKQEAGVTFEYRTYSTYMNNDAYYKNPDIFVDDPAKTAQIEGYQVLIDFGNDSNVKTFTFRPTKNGKGNSYANVMLVSFELTTI